MSCSKQKPLQPPGKAPSVLEPPSIISSKSLQHFRTAAGEQHEKKIVSGLSRQRANLSPLRARMAQSNLFPLPSIRCLTKRRGHNLSYGFFDSDRCLSTRLAGSAFFCASRPTLSIEISKSDVRNAVLPAVRHATRRVKNIRGLYV